ncbi:hypothetical protein MLD52_02785 [Puniceicoccaceae bacterium K14]|nr:hypothetical protein [Puniceicoccaceae bacterium K14]
MNLRLTAIWLGAVLVLATFAARFSSQSPDGLEYAAIELELSSETGTATELRTNTWAEGTGIGLAAILAGSLVTLVSFRKKIAQRNN